MMKEHELAITDAEREIAYELRWMIEGILMERERYVLYREAYMQSRRDGLTHEMAYRNARTAIDSMERAFMPIGEAGEGEEHGGQAKVN